MTVPHYHTAHPGCSLPSGRERITHERHLDECAVGTVVPRLDGVKLEKFEKWGWRFVGREERLQTMTAVYEICCPDHDAKQAMHDKRWPPTYSVSSYTGPPSYGSVWRAKEPRDDTRRLRVVDVVWPLDDSAKYAVKFEALDPQRAMVNSISARGFHRRFALVASMHGSAA